MSLLLLHSHRSFLLLGTLALTSFAPRVSVAEDKDSILATRVVLVTIDGVRREELQGDLDLSLDPRVRAPEPTMPFLWEILRPHGEMLGLPDSETTMTVANTEMVSLPAYMSIMAGRPQPCFGNGCGRIYMDQTLPERLVESGFAQEDVATFASWDRIAAAVETQEGASFVNAGMRAWHTNDPEVRRINDLQIQDSPLWQHARFDRYTTALALRYLQKYSPRFLYVSLNDTDEWAHRGQYREHIDAMKAADQFLHDLTTELIAQDRQDGGRSCLLVTTDHGRGRGKAWTTHSNGNPYSGLVWAFASCNLAGESAGTGFQVVSVNDSAALYTHLDIRPTIESWLGLKPRGCLLCGRPIKHFSPAGLVQLAGP